MSSSSPAQSSSSEIEDGSAPERPLLVRVLIEWGVPVAIGVVVGIGILWFMAFLESEACRIVKRWEWAEYELQDELSTELKALGDGARKDLRACYTDLDGTKVPEMLVWTADILGREPFFDARFLAEQVKTGETWQKRCAAVALVGIQKKKADSSLVLPALLEWLQDLDSETHEDAIRAVGRMLADGQVPAEWIERLRDTLIVLSDRAGRGLSGDDSDPDIPDRIGAVEALGHLISDDKVLEHVMKVAADEDECTEVRVMAVRVQSENSQKQPKVFTEPDYWTALGRTEDMVVRDAVAANLFRSLDPAFNEVLLEMHSDAHHQVRTGSISTQRDRRFHTPLVVFHELLEDHEMWVRREALLAGLTFKNQEGPGPRAGHALRLMAESDVESDVEAALVFLFGATKQAHGIRSSDVSLIKEEVDAAALQAFLKNADLRRDSVAAYAEHFGGAAVFTDADRKLVLQKLLKHADPLNVERAEAELAKLAELAKQK